MRIVFNDEGVFHYSYSEDDLPTVALLPDDLVSYPVPEGLDLNYLHMGQLKLVDGEVVPWSEEEIASQELEIRKLQLKNKLTIKLSDLASVLTTGIPIHILIHWQGKADRAHRISVCDKMGIAREAEDVAVVMAEIESRGKAETVEELTAKHREKNRGLSVMIANAEGIISRFDEMADEALSLEDLNTITAEVATVEAGIKAQLKAAGIL